jgi:nitrous oxidase accessory protein
MTLARTGDSIRLTAGRYFEHNVIIDKSVTIYSDSGAVVDAQGEAKDIFIIRADHVSIRGIRFVNVGVSFLHEASAIRLVHCEGISIENNLVDSCFFGIYIEKASCSIICDNEVTGAFLDEASAGNAVHAWKASDLIICNNKTSGHRDGIYFEFVDKSVIQNNLSKNNLRYGLHFMFSNYDFYENNTFENNGAGVAVMFSNEIIMVKNHFLHNWGGASYGLLLKEISDGEIRGNRFIKNTVGILAEGANRLLIRRNEFRLNGTAMDIKGNCLDNQIVNNNLVANTYEVVTNTRYNKNYFNQNYWSDYFGYDYDRDGYGDVAYRPVNLFAKVTYEVPSASFLLHSPLVRLMEMGEKIFPQFIPESLVDEKPRIKPYHFD